MGEMALRRWGEAANSVKRGALSQRVERKKRVIRVDLSKHSLKRFMDRVQAFRELNVSIVYGNTQGTMVTRYGVISKITFGELQGLEALMEIERITGEELREYMPTHLLRKPVGGTFKRTEYVSAHLRERRRTILLDDEPSRSWLDNLMNVLREILNRILGRD